jgi:pimeloyl-ACP methyl ester carboxylesterase
MVAWGSALALMGGLLPLSGGALAEAKSTSYSATAEAKKMDAIPTPKLSWYRCYDRAECTTVKVPRDYDSPKGAQVELALLRIKARDPKKRIGSLFVNPGGPGGSATEIAYYSNEIFSQDLRDRFDIVGMDPRGVAFSDNVRCLASAREQEEVLQDYNVAFPLTKAQETAWLKSDRRLGQACSKTALATSMSSTEVARDMELMRRAVKDSKLTYLGFSYGTYLGQVYANMFPSRFRSIAVDGVLDPVAWAGDSSNQSRPLEQRLRSADGAYKALREILSRCDKVGGQLCAFAPGNPQSNLALIADRLKKKPLEIEDEFSGEIFSFTYADLATTMLSMLYDAGGYEYVIDMLSALIVLTEPPAGVSTAQAAKRKDATKSFTEIHRRHQDQADRPRFGFPYENGLDAFASVTCTDSKETTKSASYPAYAAAADKRAPYFGRPWTWFTSVCAGDNFTGNDEDVYNGPFNTKTAAPVLVVGNYYDPATNYAAAVSAAKRLPNSRLLSSDSWGHTAYGTSECATSAVDAYLISGKLPAKGKVCKGEIQPFESSPEELMANALRQEALQKRLPQ